MFNSQSETTLRMNKLVFIRYLLLTGIFDVMLSFLDGLINSAGS